MYLNVLLAILWFIAGGIAHKILTWQRVQNAFKAGYVIGKLADKIEDEEKEEK